MKLASLRQQNFRYLRLRNRIRRPRNVFSEPPEAPIGVKLELTYACNLRCAFCYTDSPRRTLQRSTDLSDDDWRRIVREAIDAGIVEAVVTGGEPLLRKNLTLELIETLAAEGIGIAFNTNGWFVDAEVAERLRPLREVTVHLSIDGAAPHLHDASRGVPGSWRRAIEGIDHLLSAGVNVCVVHVITPENEAHFRQFLDQMWMLGVPWVRPTPVVLAGAAARGGDWKVDRGGLLATVADFEREKGTAMRVDLRGGSGGDLAAQGQRPPASMLIRPNGAVRVDSLRPFSYGNAARDGVEDCWSEIRRGWRDDRVTEWAGAMKSSADVGAGDLVAYLDDEVAIAGEASGDGESGRDAPVPQPTPVRGVEPEADMRDAAEKIHGLAMARRYRLQPLRLGGGDGERLLRRSSDGNYLRLNASAGMVMDALDGGTPADAAGALIDLGGAPVEIAERDALAATRELLASGVVAAAGGEGFAQADPGPSDLPGMEPVAEGS